MSATEPHELSDRAYLDPTDVADEANVTPAPDTFVIKRSWVYTALAAVAGGAIIITAIINGGGSPSPTQPTQATASTATVTTTATATRTTPTVRVATEREYAAVMITPAKSFEESVNTFKEHDCDVVMKQAYLCPLALMGLGTDAKIISVKLTGAAKQGVPAFVGLPPGSMTKLVADTIAAANQVDQTTAIDTPHYTMEQRSAVDRLLDLLNQWSLYY